MRTEERRRPLDRFPVIRTRNVDQMQEAVASIYGDLRMELQKGAKAFNAWGNHCPAGNVGISYSTYGTPIHLEFSGVDFFAEQFLIRGCAEVTIDGVRTEVTTQRASVISPGAQVSLDYSSDLEQLVLRVEPEALTSKLAHLTGAHPAHALKFVPTANLDRPETQSLKQMLLFLVAQFDIAEFTLPPLAMAEFEQALMVTFLCANRHNYSHLLDRQPSSIAPWQVRRAEQYIEAHWDQPITVEALVIATGVSARSLFHFFKQSRGYSPMAFLKRIRLQHARQLLTLPCAGTSVTEIAFGCGFGNLGHFSKDYFRTFGELPSQALYRAKGESPRGVDRASRQADRVGRLVETTQVQGHVIPPIKHG